MECSTHIVVDFNVACQEKRLADDSGVGGGLKNAFVQFLCIFFPSALLQIHSKSSSGLSTFEFWAVSQAKKGFASSWAPQN
jgi:hypothetical protein